MNWLAQDLPLQGRPVVALVTASPSSTAGVASVPLASPVASPLRVEAPGAMPGNAASESIVAAFPRLQQPLDVPIPGAPGLEGAMPATSPGGKGSELGPSSKDAEGDEPADDLAVHVWLYSPLGPSVATISAEHLQRSAAGGGAPLVAVAKPHGDAAIDEPAHNGHSKLEVMLQFKAERHAAPPASRRLSRGPSGSASSGSSSGSWGPVAGSIGGGPTPAILAVLCLPLLAAWLQLVLQRGQGDGTASVLTSVAFLVNSLAALVAIVVVQLKCRPAPAPEQVGRFAELGNRKSTLDCTPGSRDEMRVMRRSEGPLCTARWQHQRTLCASTPASQRLADARPGPPHGMLHLPAGPACHGSLVAAHTAARGAGAGVAARRILRPGRAPHRLLVFPAQRAQRVGRAAPGRRPPRAAPAHQARLLGSCPCLPCCAVLQQRRERLWRG